MRSPVHALVQDLDLFKGLPEREAQGVLAEARLRKIAEGGSVFVQGAPALRFYMLVEGRLKIVQTSPQGQQIIAHWVAPSQFFGLAVAQGRDTEADLRSSALSARQPDNAHRGAEGAGPPAPPAGDAGSGDVRVAAGAHAPPCCLTIGASAPDFAQSGQPPAPSLPAPSSLPDEPLKNSRPTAMPLITAS